LKQENHDTVLEQSSLCLLRDLELSSVGTVETQESEINEIFVDEVDVTLFLNGFLIDVLFDSTTFIIASVCRWRV
jgi:hypothetical protein